MKRKLVIFFSVLLAAALMLPAGAAGTILWGDADSDAAVSARDLSVLRRYLASYDYVSGQSSVRIGAGGDVNGSGAINGVDLSLMRRYFASYDYTTGRSVVVLGPDENEKTVRVGISNCGTTSKAQVYVNSVTAAGATAVILPVFNDAADAAEWLAGVDALVMTGGGDIDASYYGEENQPYQGPIDPVRDRSDFLLISEALKTDLPMLCVCRGMQILNVVCGGTLYQDIVEELPALKVVHRDPAQKVFVRHDISITPGSTIASILSTTEASVNSWHHQAIKTLGEGLKVTAVSPDGIVEGVELSGSTFVLGVQFHPEYHVKNGNMIFLGFFEALLAAAK